ncbi:hypothetical protein [Rikenella microfusus]|uniref:hypothetical protein n=1 Tax=Rikenella microfusus TaxID=28139 RepID=UPI000684DA8F|nr:hypothetical protein [Rikenella microfusus]
MPNNTFRFLRTWEIETFRKTHPLGEMQIIQSPKTGKHFFVFEGIRGTVTRSYQTEPLIHPVISEILNRKTGETFLLLHNQSEKRTKEPFSTL